LKACVATGEKWRIECRDIPIPELPKSGPGLPGWLLLKTKYASICGSDLEYLGGYFGPINPGSIPGHEFIAEVVEVGEGVQDWSVGDRAIPLGTPNPFEKQTSYENYKCMAEFFVSTSQGVIKVPDHVPDEDAVFVEPLWTANGAVAECDLRAGQSVVVIGVGKIGLLTVMASKLAGAKPIISIDLVKSRLDKSLEIGSDFALNANDVDVVREVKKITGGTGEMDGTGGADVIIIAVRDAKVLNHAVMMAKTRAGARIALSGFVEPMEVQPHMWVTKALRIIGILGGSPQDSLYIISHKQIDPKPLITEIISFDEVQRAFDSYRNGENIVVLLKP
jgi:(R,R)-butanediol dehydrogenase/meso-butanediol dehydrogenase/diacetyl reductase